MNLSLQQKASPSKEKILKKDYVTTKKNISKDSTKQRTKPHNNRDAKVIALHTQTNLLKSTHTSKFTFSLPNILTIARLCSVPLLIGLSYSQDWWILWCRNILFIAAAATDFFDGYFARRFGQLSRIGQLLDALADKLLIVPFLVILAAMGALPGPHLLPALVIIGREICVPTLRERYMETFGKGLQSDTTAQWKTALLLCSIACLLMGISTPDTSPTDAALLFSLCAYEVGLCLLYISSILGMTSFYGYARATFKKSL